MPTHQTSSLEASPPTPAALAEEGGQLLHAGPEYIVETSYNLAVFTGAKLSLDYQFVGHPAYNRDRGPVSIFGIRTHGEF
jgi:high affinity Mn2+ porin